MLRNYYQTVIFTAALIIFGHEGVSNASGLAPERRLQPLNFVLVFVDDMGWADFSCFGNTEIQTPHIDQMALEGLRFEQFYVNSPICSPSRVAISTGQYPHRWDITSYLNNRLNNEERGIAQWLDPTAPMLARFLQQSGYATGHFGKWHMGGQRDVGEAPLITTYGFDQSLTNFEGLGPRVLPLLNKYDGSDPKKYALGSDKLGHGPITWENRSDVTARFVEAAVTFIDQSQKSQQPFYINVWPDDVHSPFFPPEARRGNEEKHQLYLGVLKTMDEQLSVLFDRIKKDPQLREQTVVLICSDNGPEGGAGSAGEFRGHKTMLFEGGIRSPLIVWSPSKMNPKVAGTVNRDSVLAAIDLAPSVLSMAGVSVPDDIAFDGQDLSETLLGHSDRSRTAPIYFRRPPDRDNDSGISDLPDLAIRDGNWKLLCEYDGSKAQLYDLTKDIGEKQNIASQHPERVTELVSKLVSWHESMPQDNGATYLRKERP